MQIKKIILGTAIVGSTAIFSSCATSSLVKGEQAVFREVTGLVTHIPVTADLDVKSQKIQGVHIQYGVYNKATKTYYFDVESAKAAATVNALEKNGADILIAPIYSLEQKGGLLTVKVSGYPGIYKNFRPATAKDKELLEITPSKLSREANKTGYIERKN